MIDSKEDETKVDGMKLHNGGEVKGWKQNIRGDYVLIVRYRNGATVNYSAEIAEKKFGIKAPISERIRYGRMYNENLYKPREEDIISEENLPKELQGKGIIAYDAGIDFRMLVHVDLNNGGEKGWNNVGREDAESYSCWSYIRNDMATTINSFDSYGQRKSEDGITYGVEIMDESSYLYSAPEDIETGTHGMLMNGVQDIFDGYIHEAKGTMGYYTPDDLINSMYFGGYGNRYNEIGYERIQGGQVKQPDYIVTFIRNGLLDDEPQKLIDALKSWKHKNLKLVIVDIDKCLEAEKNKLQEMISEYKKNNDPTILDAIGQKINNNRHTDELFYIDLPEEYKDYYKKWRAKRDLTVGMVKIAGGVKVRDTKKLIGEITTGLEMGVQGNPSVDDSTSKGD